MNFGVRVDEVRKYVSKPFSHCTLGKVGQNYEKEQCDAGYKKGCQNVISSFKFTCRGVRVLGTA